jgi:hypothetical protein
MHPEHHDRGTLTVRVPRGNDGYWAIIRRLAESQGTFTAADVDGASNTDIGSVRRYVRALHRAGFLDVVRIERTKAKQPRHVYALKVNQATTPRFRGDGTPIGVAAQKQIWTAIRALKQFTLPELVFAATTPECRFGAVWAKRYLTMLHQAGYLVQLKPAAGQHRHATWRLKPSMDTGPRPPERRRITTDALWDPNLKKFVGDEPVASEVLS